MKEIAQILTHQRGNIYKPQEINPICVSFLSIMEKLELFDENDAEKKVQFKNHIT